MSTDARVVRANMINVLDGVMKKNSTNKMISPIINIF